MTNATLSDRLKHLQANGLVERCLYRTSPDKFEYVLTQKGWLLAPMMPVLAQNGDQLGVPGASKPPLIFANRRTGAEVRWGLVDQATGKHVIPSDIQIKEGPGADDLVRWRASHDDRRAGGATT